MGGLDLDLGEVFFLQDNITSALVFEPFHDLVRGDFLRVGFRDLLILDRAQVAGAKLPETELLFAGRRINGDGNVNETEADTALPDRTHSRRSYSQGGHNVNWDNSLKARRDELLFVQGLAAASPSGPSDISFPAFFMLALPAPVY